MLERAIILAAGFGSRLRPHTNNAPKCLTLVNERPILVNCLDALASAGVRECAVVTGYLAEAVRSAVGGSHSGMKVRHVLNERYSETNDMYSLWLARDLLERGAYVFEGDVFFRPSLLPEAEEAMETKSYYFAGAYDGRKNEVRIETSPERRVIAIDVFRNGNSGPTGENVFFSAGFLAVRPEFGVGFSRWLSEYVERGEVNVLFDDVLAAHTGEAELFVHEITFRDWVEIDAIEDLVRAEEIFC